MRDYDWTNSKTEKIELMEFPTILLNPLYNGAISKIGLKCPILI
jgi:hypothetical protein